MTANKPLPPVDAVRLAGALPRLAKAPREEQLDGFTVVDCVRCGGVELSDLDASGAGTIRSFTIIRRAVSSAFEADVPYVVALVTLAEGPTVMANILDAPLDALAIGASVELVFERRNEEINVPQFRWSPQA